MHRQQQHDHKTSNNKAILVLDALVTQLVNPCVHTLPWHDCYLEALQPMRLLGHCNDATRLQYAAQPSRRTCRSSLNSHEETLHCSFAALSPLSLYHLRSGGQWRQCCSAAIERWQFSVGRWCDRLMPQGDESRATHTDFERSHLQCCCLPGDRTEHNPSQYQSQC
jgi:hypothetical protein